MERWYQAGSGRHWPSLRSHRRVQRVALGGGRGCFQAGRPRARFHVPEREGEREGVRGEDGGGGAGRGGLAGEQAERERKRGRDGREKERGHRFVNAEIGRVAPRREPSADLSVPL